MVAEKTFQEKIDIIEVDRGIDLLHVSKLPFATGVHIGPTHIIYPSMEGFCAQGLNESDHQGYIPYDQLGQDRMQSSVYSQLTPAILADRTDPHTLHVVGADRNRFSVAGITVSSEMVSGKLVHQNLLVNHGRTDEDLGQPYFSLALKERGVFILGLRQPLESTASLMTYEPEKDDLKYLTELPSNVGVPVCCGDANVLYWCSRIGGENRSKLIIIDAVTGDKIDEIVFEARVCAMNQKPDGGIVMITDGIMDTPRILYFDLQTGTIKTVSKLRHNDVGLTGPVCFMPDADTLLIAPKYQNGIPLVAIRLSNQGVAYRTELSAGGGEVFTEGQIVQFTTPSSHDSDNPTNVVAALTNKRWAYQISLDQFAS